MRAHACILAFNGLNIQVFVHGRNPLYLGVIFVAFLLVKALWVQLDISGEFRNGAVSIIFYWDCLRVILRSFITG